MQDLLTELIMENIGILDNERRLPRDLQFVKCSFSWEAFGRITVFIFRDGRPAPWMIAKISRKPCYENHFVRQYNVLQQIVGALPKALERAIPKMHLLSDVKGHSFLFEEFMPGRSFASYRRKRLQPNLAVTEGLLEVGTRWLENFHMATVRKNRQEQLAKQIKELIQLFEKQYQPEEEMPYLARLLSEAEKLATSLDRLVGMHGDFGPRNLLLADGAHSMGSFRIVDWEFVELESFPLLDIMTFLIGVGVTEMGGYSKSARQRAFLNLLQGTSDLTRVLKRHLLQSLDTLEVEPSILHHLFPLILIKLSLQHPMWYGCRTDTSRLWRERFRIYVHAIESRNPCLPFGLG